MPKKKAKAKAGKKVIQKQKQTVIVNVTKRGGGGKSKARPSAPRPQQIPNVIFQQPQQQIPHQERPQERPHTNERERSHADEILNVIQQTNAIYRQQPPPQAVTTTNVDVGSILTGTATVLKTGLDIYKNYSRGQQEQKQEQQREERRVEVPASNIPARPSARPPAPPAIPPRPAARAPIPRPPVAPIAPIPVAPTPIAPVTPRPVQTPSRPVPTFRTPRTPKPSQEEILGKIREKETPKKNYTTTSDYPVIPKPAPPPPSFHIKNILGQIEFKGAMSAARNEIKRGEEIRRKPEEKKVSLGQLGAKSILRQEQKIEKVDNSDFLKIASRLRREGIKMGNEGKAAMRETQRAKSASSARDRPVPPPSGIGRKKKTYN